VSFVHLHCHTEYSLLDGANRIDDLIERALEFEQPALAITDHGNMHCAWEFQEKAHKAGIRPLLGMEAYVAPGDRRTREREGNRKPYFHLVILAKNQIGYRNLAKSSRIPANNIRRGWITYIHNKNAVSPGEIQMLSIRNHSPIPAILF